MKKILIFIFVLISIISHGQNLFPEKFSNCECDVFFLEGKEIFAQKQDDVLLNEILEQIDSEVISKIKGEVSIQVIINADGVLCCMSMKNNLNEKAEK